MSKIIAITGKGGVGKTTISGLLVTRLISNNYEPVLAVDADPNTCLDINLGITANKTVGGIREEAREIAGKGLSSGISKQQLLEMKIAESLVECKNFDYIAMGRPEGPGCYCYANNVLKEVLKEIAVQYPYVVLDNEAGLENLSRRIIQKVNLLVFVSDSSLRGLDTVLRLYQLAQEMEIKFDKLAIFVNRQKRNEITNEMSQMKKITGSDYLISFPENEEIGSIAEKGESLFNLSEKNEVVLKIDDFIKELI